MNGRFGPSYSAAPQRPLHSHPVSPEIQCRLDRQTPEPKARAVQRRPSFFFPAQRQEVARAGPALNVGGRSRPALLKCCSICPRSIRSTLPSYRKWIAQVRECGMHAAGTALGPARHLRPPDLRCSGRRVREDRGGVPPTGI